MFIQLDNLCDCNRISTCKHLVPNQTLNHLANLAHLASLAKWLSVCLQTKCLWVRTMLKLVKFQILRLFRAKNSLTFPQLQSVDSL